MKSTIEKNISLNHYTSMILKNDQFLDKNS